MITDREPTSAGRIRFLVDLGDLKLGQPRRLRGKLLDDAVCLLGDTVPCVLLSERFDLLNNGLA